MLNFFKKKDKESKDEIFVEPKEDYSNIEDIVDYFKKETGVSFEKQITILNNKVVTFCRLRQIYSFTKLLDIVKTDKKTKQELIDYLTTNETFFYREVQQIKDLVHLVQNSHKDVEILCAPSSTGEEPYSIVIALLEAGVLANKFKVTGIDINSDALKRASIAQYKERNIRNLSKDVVNKYFTKNEDIYVLRKEITSLVSFKQINIFDDNFKSLGKFDFIFSRNMLIYFDKETKLKAKEILESMRKDKKHGVFFGHADLF